MISPQIRSLAILALLLACAPSPENVEGPENLLAQRLPAEVRGVMNIKRLTDGIEAEPGAPWRSDLTPEFRNPASEVTYDFRNMVVLRAVYLQADNNDSVILSIGDSTQTFRDVWVAGPHPDSGMQARHTDQIDVRAQYLRLRVAGGDGRFSISEVQVFSEPGVDWASTLVRRESVSADSTEQRPQRTAVLIWALAIAGLLLADRRSFSLPVRVGEALGAAAVSVYVVSVFAEDWPARFLTVAFVKSMLTLVAAAALIRLAFWRRDADRRILGAALGLTAVLAVFAFYNLGTPQFRHAQTGEPSFIHYWDLRVYHPTVKYFDELGFDGLYWASAKAYLEDTGTSVWSVADHPLRDLRDYTMTTIGGAHAEIEAAPTHFSPERWADFKHDMTYFRHAMADGYLESLRDHGANATPVWMLAAIPFFRWTSASDAVFEIAGLLDPLLLLGFLFAAGRSFGWAKAFLCLVLFGVSSFPMHGSNWAGATLRNDWMILLGLSLCALKTERWMLGGILLGWSAMIRAFPVLGVGALALPTFWWAVEYWRVRRRLPRWSEFKAERRPFLRAATGVAAAVFVLGAMSTVMFGAEQGWARWTSKITSHASKPNVNHVGLRTVVTYTAEAPPAGQIWAEQQEKLRGDRQPILVFFALMFVAACVVACRRLSESQAVVAGMMLLPILFYPANYYLHFIFLVPLLAVDEEDGGDPRWAGTGLVLLAMSFAATFSESAISMHAKFTHWSIGLLIGWVLIYGERVSFALQGGFRRRGGKILRPQSTTPPKSTSS